VEIAPTVTATPDVPDKALQDLLERRVEAAHKALQTIVALYGTGRTSAESVFTSLERFTDAGIEAAQSPAERVTHCEAALRMAKVIEEAVIAKHKAEVEPDQIVALATYTRLDTEIKLHRARKSAGK
jgi:hypothetical protein